MTEKIDSPSDPKIDYNLAAELLVTAHSLYQELAKIQDSEKLQQQKSMVISLLLASLGSPGIEHLTEALRKLNLLASLEKPEIPILADKQINPDEWEWPMDNIQHTKVVSELKDITKNHNLVDLIQANLRSLGENAAYHDAKHKVLEHFLKGKRAAAGAFHTDGKTLYSYALPLAEKKDSNVFHLPGMSQSHSRTTSKHQNFARTYLPHGAIRGLPHGAYY